MPIKPQSLIHAVAAVAVLVTVSACGTLPLEHMKAERDFAGCVKYEMNVVTGRDWSDFQKGNALAGAAKCEEALGNRALAIQYHNDSAAHWDLTDPQFAEDAVAERKRVAELASGAAMVTADALSREAQGTLDYVAAHRGEASSLSSDDDDTASSDETNAALMGMAMGMMSQPAFVPRGRRPAGRAPMPSFASNPVPASTRQTPSKPVSTYRDATYCASIGPADRNSIITLTDHCNGPITVHLGTGLGGEFVNLAAGQTRHDTTNERRIAYACFRKSDQDDYCFKSLD